jgi:autophagy-related protein 11
LTASDTLATLANSWGMPFGRKKKSELGNSTAAVEIPVNDARDNTQNTTDNTLAHDSLK